MQKVCKTSDIIPETGVCALVDGRQIAIFRTRSDTYFAIDNFDPFSKTNILSRGILGGTTVDNEEVIYVASPMYKQRFDLATGQCLDDMNVSVNCYQVTTEGNDVLVGEPLLA